MLDLPCLYFVQYFISDYEIYWYIILFWCICFWYQVSAVLTKWVEMYFCFFYFPEVFVPIIIFFKVSQNSSVKPSGSQVFFWGKFFIMKSTFKIDIGYLDYLLPFLSVLLRLNLLPQNFPIWTMSSDLLA